MRLTKRRREPTSQVDMTPMIDIVFLLIIFFMTVSQISAVNNERVELPRLEGSEEQQPVVLTINVTQDGEIVVAGNRLTLPNFIRLVSQELVKVGDDPTRLKLSDGSTYCSDVGTNVLGYSLLTGETPVGTVVTHKNTKHAKCGPTQLFH